MSDKPSNVALDSSGITVYNGDVLDVLSSLPSGKADLVFADPPFNLKKKYEGRESEDDMPRGEYYAWCDRWIQEAWRVLSPTGSFFLMTIQNHTGAMWTSLDKQGFLNNLIIWKNSSMPVKNKFCIAYQPILWFVKNPKDYTFNYGFETRNSTAVLPWGKKNNANSIRDIWEDIPFISGGCMASKEAILAPGTKKKAHPCQMPVGLAKRIVGYCSNEGDTVLDLFCGSGTVPEACAVMGRKCIGIEQSEVYCGDIKKRLSRVVTGLAEDNSLLSP